MRDPELNALLLRELGQTVALHGSAQSTGHRLVAARHQSHECRGHAFSSEESSWLVNFG